MALIFMLNSKMSLILAVSLYIWASLFVVGKHLMASSAKLRHHTKWKDPILLAVTVLNNKQQQYNFQKQQSSNKLNKNNRSSNNNQNWKQLRFQQQQPTFLMWWSLRALKSVKCNFRCYGYRGCSITFLTLIRHLPLHILVTLSFSLVT